MRRTLVSIIFLCSAAQPLLAQREAESTDRLTRRDDLAPPSRIRSLLLAVPTPTTNAYLKVAGTVTDADREVSPAATLGLNHRDPQHPWFGEVSYKYRSGDTSHHNVFSGLANYQFWTGAGAFSPLLVATGAYSKRPGSNETAGADITAEISYGSLSLDAIAGYAWFRPKDGDKVQDFVPGLSAYYALSDADMLGLDYTFKNDVDEEDGFALSFRHKISPSYSIDIVAFKHNDVRLRIRRNFAPFRTRSMVTP